MSDLKPCPFCGGDALELNGYNIWKVSCSNEYCKVFESVFLREEWNARADGWISVNDRLPDDDDEMLVCFGEDVTTAQYNPWGGECHKKWYEWQDIPGYGSQKGEVIGVTHWMPLPKPPKQ